jgi:hypothetical protein
MQGPLMQGPLMQSEASVFGFGFEAPLQLSSGARQTTRALISVVSGYHSLRYRQPFFVRSIWNARMPGLFLNNGRDDDMSTNNKRLRKTTLVVGSALIGGTLIGACGGAAEDDLVLGTKSQDLGFGHLRPVVDCMDDLGGGNYRAHFGYENTTGRTREVRVGLLNFFVPQPRDQGQPTTFLVGEHQDVFTVDFAVGDGWDRVAWWLSAHRALVTANTPLCDGGPDPECDADSDCLDDNDCTLDLCVSGACSNPDAPVGTVCGPGGLTCDASGNCN